MRKSLAVAWMFLIVSFGSAAQSLVHSRHDPTYLVGLKTYSSLADTPESPDEHVREKQHDVGNAL
ncbi:hypothetical protein [Pantoea sp. PNA 03-3]|uniref:hypothetical protein n=1 Tax=Pantoea sp. PNA 03-3 TaxID=2135460 RepID=UPI000D758F93|nr:hypothetical protein [Pantoea sp. PNA 03-3]PXV77894.1 hypothetical protein C7433_101102 [Pantoea sp. PNA 03-3]